MAFKFTHDDINKMRAEALKPLQPGAVAGNGGGGGLKNLIAQLRNVKGERK